MTQLGKHYQRNEEKRTISGSTPTGAHLITDEKIEIKVREIVKELNNNLRTFIIIIVTVMLAFGSAIGLLVKSQYESRNDIDLLKIEQEKLSYMMKWSIELSEIQRDYIKALSEDEDVSEFLDKLEDIERRIYGAEGLPTYRGGTKMSEIISSK